jgi:hypothetical protein
MDFSPVVRASFPCDHRGEEGRRTRANVHNVSAIHVDVRAHVRWMCARRAVCVLCVR